MNGFSHHWDVFKAAWKADKEHRKSFIPSSEADFLPAALEVIERPVSPTGRITAWILLIGLVLTVAWAVFGRVDVVASAPGELIPTGNIKLVQSSSPGVVRAIHVRDGDIVRKGQALIDLDPTLSGADLAQAQKALTAAQLEIARNRAIADALAGKPFRFDPPADTPAEVAETQRRLIAAQLADIEAASASLSAARSSALSDVRSAEAQVARLRDTLPLLDRQIENMNRLDAKGYAPGLRLLEMQRQRRQEAGDLAVAQTQISRGFSEARRLEEQVAQTRAAARREALDALAKAEADAILRQEEVTKAGQRNDFQRLVASDDGTIQQLAVHTIGGVVEAAKPLMTLVPSRGGLEVKARILNKDVGFVRVGQRAAVKLEAFPFTRYGTVPARVRSISRDAVQDEKLGPVYIAAITLDRSHVVADGRQVVLSPGLAATVDVRTGSRSIVSYLLSPLQATVEQAGRER